MSVWSRKRRELAQASSREFERLALPLLRAIWPALTHPRELSPLDKRGIDLVVWSDDGCFPVVVQCKGFFQEEQLVSAQLPQIRKSIASFQSSAFTCQTYVLLHNRTGEDRDATQEILALLGELEKNGKAKQTHLWDRRTFLERVQARLREMIDEGLAQRATTTIDTQSRFFRFGHVHVDPVPGKVEHWRFAQSGRIRPQSSDQRRLSPSQIIGAQTRRKWTLLIGHFGLGKSTFALQAAAAVANKLVYVHSAEITDVSGSVGTNHLLRKILQALDVFEEFDEHESTEFARLGGILLKRLISQPEAGYALVLDGLDESPRYCTARGLMQLTNELEELRCPVVLVTRKEHFDATFGNFEVALSKMMVDQPSTKRGHGREARVCHLEEWGPSQIEQFFSLCAAAADESERTHVQALASAVLSGQLDGTFGGLLRHPLFLQMIAGLASEGEPVPEYPATLINDWTRLKIERDLRSGRKAPWPVEDMGEFVEQMVEVIEDVAIELAEVGDAHVTLKDDISLDQLRATLARRGLTDVDTGAFVNTSLLIPVGPRQGRLMRVKFYHRVFQEFFLARRWAGQAPSAKLPQAVQFWITAIEATAG